MFWKNWPYWLKGGMLLIIIAILMTIVLVPFGTVGLKGWDSLVPWFLYPLILLGYKIIPTVALDSLGFMPAPSIPIVLIITTFVAYFIIGSVFGWIYGKIKKQK